MCSRQGCKDFLHCEWNGAQVCGTPTFSILSWQSTWSQRTSRFPLRGWYDSFALIPDHRASSCLCQGGVLVLYFNTFKSTEPLRRSHNYSQNPDLIKRDLSTCQWCWNAINHVFEWSGELLGTKTASTNLHVNFSIMPTLQLTDLTSSSSTSKSLQSDSPLLDEADTWDPRPLHIVRIF